METVIIPDENVGELVEIPGYAKKKIKFMPVRNMDEVVKIVFGEMQSGDE
ncbi:MAG: Lon protease [Deltaproteobacteria bacterium ADurb.Bin026]|nr:MAG: Lon protease [Deltaproteobacteria bacterium ADurb.Bin026]